MDYKKKGVHPRGYWFGEGIEEEHCFDSWLASALVLFFKIEKARSIVDFGCGMGKYVEMLRNEQFHCEGYDGNPDTPLLSGGIASTLDLSKPVDLGRRFDWVLSLEVGEHIPQRYERVFIENLDKHNTQGIVLSWSLEGQGGFGHFNVQNNDYIKSAMRTYGYTSDESAEASLRLCSHLPWFRHTIMVFRRSQPNIL